MSIAVDAMTLPIVTCVGEARNRGRVHGEALRGTIAEGLDRWLDALGQRHGIAADDYVSEFLGATNHLPAIRRWTPDLLEEVHGIAEGANQPFPRMLAFNLMDEEWSYGQTRRHDLAPGCTVACFRAAGGAPVIAQNMDLPSVHDGTQAVLRLRPDDGPDVLIFTMAGFVGLMGANAAGVGVVVNNLDMLPSSASGLPVAFVVRAILASPSLAAATDFVRRVPHAIGQHYAIGGPDGLASFECAANGAVRDETATDRVLHTNHPLVNDAISADAEWRYAGTNTRARYDLVASRAAELTDLAGVERVLADTTAPVSREPRRGFMTVGSMAAELSVPPRVRFAPGPPHTTPYVDVPFSA